MAAPVVGAALPKAPQEVKRSSMPRCECFECGEGRGNFTRAQLRGGVHPCRCGGWLIPSRLDDCAEFAPEHLDAHPLYRLERERETRALLRQSGGGAGSVARGSRCIEIGCNTHTVGVHSRCAACARAYGETLPKTHRLPLASMVPATRAERTAEAMAKLAEVEMPF